MKTMRINSIIAITVFFIGNISTSIWAKVPEYNQDTQQKKSVNKTSTNNSTSGVAYKKYPLSSYDMIMPFHEGLAAVSKNEKIGFINKSGYEVIPCQYDNATEFKEGISSVILNNLTGFINKTGKLVIPYKYSPLFGYGFYDGVACVAVDSPDYNEKWYVIDKTGKTQINCTQYSSLEFFSEGLALVAKDNKFGFINRQGIEVIPCIYDYDSNSFDYQYFFKEGLCKVVQNGKYGFINNEGDVVIPIKYSSANNFSCGMASVSKDGKDFFIDQLGNKVFECNNFETISDFSDGMLDVMFTVDNTIKLGYVNKTGETVISPIYDHASSFSEGLAAVAIEEKYGFIDKTGKIVIPFIYDSALDFSEGLAIVDKNGKSMCIDKTGKVIFQ